MSDFHNILDSTDDRIWQWFCSKCDTMTTVEMSYKAQTKQQLMQRFLDYEKQEQAFKVLLKLHQI